MFKNRPFRFVFRLCKKLLIIFFVSTILMVLLYRAVPVYFTPLMAIRALQQLGNSTSLAVHHSWVPLESISPHLIQAVVASEDNLFMDHSGFDFEQIKKAIEENKRRKKPRGASTITQQTAKNVFLWPESSFIRKGFEVYFSVLIELIWGKKRIMEVYLNSIEMGNGIYGAESVAQMHFGKPAAKLTAAESATIAATLPNPRQYNSAQPSSYVQSRSKQIQRLMTRIAKVDFEKDNRKK